MKQSIRIIGMVNTFYVVDTCDGHNCDFTWTKDVGEKHALYGYSQNDDKVKIQLEMSEGECSSGWTVASYATLDISNVNKFPPFSHVPINRAITISIDPDEDDIDCEAFSFSAEGSNEYYPCGSYTIKDVFNTTPRHHSNRIVYVFYGPSGVGKSYIADHLSELSVYDTDCNEALPDVIYTDVVVVGNKYKHSIDDVTGRLFKEPIVRMCEFK